MWVYPDQFNYVILRFILDVIRFLGSVETLMEGSGLAILLESTFEGVLKMLFASFEGNVFNSKYRLRY